MTLATGTKLGPYEITSAIGAGGMGEVYRARDTRLERIVAVKILPDHLADRAELRERFEREARTIASLNHPHICTLFDIGQQDGINFLVMEYLEGETLAQRLKKGPLPLEQVLQYAIEIADALDKAHRKGITHRDLKPGNVMLTKSGPKLLDFGLAKLKQEVAPANVQLSQLPTANDPLTAQGTIVGTLQYMAPEQLEGKEVDARTDIFAFGFLVYEMATGKKAFEGKSQASLISAIMSFEPPPMSSLQPMTPPALDRVVKRCLAKDPDERWQSARDICEQLRWISDSGSSAGVTAPAVAPQNLKKRIVWITAAVAILVAALVTAVLYFRQSPAGARTVRFTVAPPEKQTFLPGPNATSFLSVSPDGNRLAFVAADSTGHSMLWIRDLDSQTAQPLSGTDGATEPFWSPDSRFIAFTAGASLKSVAVTGGPAQTLTASPAIYGGTWNRNGVILFGTGTAGPILRVSSAGGSATPVTSLDPSRQQLGHEWPIFLPDGRHFLYVVDSANPEDIGIYVGSLDSKEAKLLLKATSMALYSPPGYLLFLRARTLLAQPFDADRLELKGDAIPIAEGVQFFPVNNRAVVAVSENGVLAYRSVPANALKLVWVDRKGAEQPLPAPPHNYVMPRVSPDGQRVVAGIEEADGQIWVYDLSRDTLTRLTFEGTNNIDPLWTPDGKRIVFKGNKNRLFWQPADGSGPPEELTKSELGPNSVPGSFSPDGQVLAFMGNNPSDDLYTLPLSDGKPQPFLRSSSNQTAPRFSPDGHFIAYASNESGRYEIYVRPYPGPGGKWQISTDGGGEPVWNPKGRELFYRNGNKMMAVDVTTQGTFSAGKPRVLFEGRYAPTPRSFQDYDVSPDGQRFLMLKATEQAQSPEQINVVLNWFEELKQKVPAAKK